MRRVKILKIEPLTHDVKRFLVSKPKGYKFVSGQATELAIDLPDCADKKRPFTFTSLNTNDYLEFIIKSYPVDKYPKHGGVTEKLHQLKEGDNLLIGEPWGNIHYKDVGVFIAGGVGITPFLAIFRQLGQENRLLGNRLIFSNKTAGDVILENELRRFFEEKDLVITLTREKRSGYEQGRVDRKLLKKYISDFSANFYLCGPGEMVSGLKDILESLGVGEKSLVYQK